MRAVSHLKRPLNRQFLRFPDTPFPLQNRYTRSFKDGSEWLLTRDGSESFCRCVSVSAE
jgi:hypothetical protein